MEPSAEILRQEVASLFCPLGPPALSVLGVSSVLGGESVALLQEGEGLTTAPCANSLQEASSPALRLSELLCLFLIAPPPGPGEGRRGSFSVPRTFPSVFPGQKERVASRGLRFGLQRCSHAAKVSCVASGQAFTLSGPRDIHGLSGARGWGRARIRLFSVWKSVGGSWPGCGDIPDLEKGVGWGSPSVAPSTPSVRVWGAVPCARPQGIFEHLECRRSLKGDRSNLQALCTDR